MDFCNDVVKLIARIIGRLSPDLILLIKKKVNKGRKLRNKSMLFILDCDTHKDIECILKVLEDLHNVGIKPLLAVPGELLIQGQEVYKQVSLKGYKFINHGFKQHTFIDEKGRYVSNYFYEKINKVERQNDILGGHKIIEEILQKVPEGFRTPHFGTYCSAKNLRELYRILKNLNYTFSSSTTPIHSIVKGDVFRTNNIIELPVSGCYKYPVGIPDSFNFIFSNNLKIQKNNLIEELRNLAISMQKGSLLKVNLYADPSQIAEWKEYFNVLGNFREWNTDKLFEYAETL